MKNLSNNILDGLKESNLSNTEFEERKEFLYSMYDKIKEAWDAVEWHEPMHFEPDMYVDELILILNVEWGDWKHEHLALDEIAKKATHPIDIEVKVTEENGSDSYSAEHWYYYAPIKKESISIRKEKNMSKAILEATEDEEYEKYMAKEKELADGYYKQLCDNVTDERRQKFNSLKELTNDDIDYEKDLVDGFYIPRDFIFAVEGSGEGHHLNPYMDLSTTDLYFLVYENDTIEDALKHLFDTYKADSAYSWGDNFLYALDKVNPSAYQEFKDEQSMEAAREDDEDLDESVDETGEADYEAIEANVMNAVYKSLSETDGTKNIEVLSGAPVGANNSESKSSVKFELDGITYVVNIMKIDGELNYL